ncbi:2TM domain-containing protein [Winogradskyella eckloniae]|uniref:2TM domain-containing protein n=1 Tax=Winogradskyella eckloniae TaxID=1089306 RepID=UPI0015643ED0|nr:2TM domain-containing protein [Winogradskyella eckloniae]NRD19685.1 2TM domain-containing protein [Winogradskyella eckloniae]
MKKNVQITETMTSQEKEIYRKAKEKVRRVKIFYLHLALYLVVVALLLYNLYIVSGPYKNNIISLNLSVLVAWTVFISLHGINVFKRKQIFNKNWEDEKIKGFLKEEKEEESTFWE